MRSLALALAALLALAFVCLTAQPVDAQSSCVAGNAWNTGGSSCEGLVCTGWSGDGSGWQKCYGSPPCDVGCPPPY
jgi:hypothetical protein